MKNKALIILSALLISAGACKEPENNSVPYAPPSPEAQILSMKIAGFPVTLETPGGNEISAKEGSVTITGPWENSTVTNPKIQIIHSRNAELEYAAGKADFSADLPVSLSHGSTLRVKVADYSSEKAQISYYKIKVTVQNSNEGYGTKDAAWAADAYNAKYRVFPNAPEYGILSYDDIGAKAPVSYWNTQGHNHKYPDLFHFANGNKVETIADWENRRQEISNILQYYMHGRMPSIDTDVLRISWKDNGNTCNIKLTHIPSNRRATFDVVHTPPDGAQAGAKSKILLFGVGMAPNASRHAGWGTAAFQTAWGGSESNRTGTCATLYGLANSAADTPSVNMEYAWAMSVILTVIEQGGLGGYYDPQKVGIYGFSRWGKAAMIIGAFAESLGGNRIGETFIGSAGSGGPAIDRWINQMGYKGHGEDPLPVSGGGINTSNEYTGITWYLKDIQDDHNAATAREAVRGWTDVTPGIPAGANIYNEAYDDTRNPGPPNSWGRIQVLSQARGETPGWFSARFSGLNDLHSGARLDQDSGGIVCTMPFDAHFISALIAPRIVYFEDGYNTMRNNPEGQWANWLMTDEVYQMYAEKENDSSIIWRNAIKMYDIEHMHQSYQDQDEYDLVTAIYAGTQPNTKFRTPPFPVDDPRYRWDFDRMDFGRTGRPTIATRVKLMRENSAPVKAMDTRGLLDAPEPLD